MTLQALALRIRAEVGELARVAQRAGDAWQRAVQNQDDYYVDSVALSLHGFYNGLERLFELIAIDVDGQRPAGDAWHRTLLLQMAQDMRGSRPAVISSATLAQLDTYRGFRHLVRNVYTYNLDPAKVKHLVDDLPATLAQVTAELLAFADFLDAQSS